MNNLTIYNGDEIILELLVDQSEPSGDHMAAHLDDNSYRDCVIMGDHVLKLSFSSHEFMEIPVGAYCVFKGVRYTLERPENLTKKGSRIYEYSLTLDAPQAKLKSFMFRNTVPGDRRLKFSLTARPHEHLQMLIDNLNERDSGWTIGECVDAFEKVISYNHTSCSDALSLIANGFGTEWEINDKVISLRKIEYFKDNPMPLSYGKGNGFVPGLGRTNFDNSMPIQRLFAQGGERNIDRSKYGSSELHMPPNATIAYDGTHFEGEEGFNDSIARHYAVDSDGFSVVRTDKDMDIAEASLDLSDIYPSRVGEVTSVEVVDEDGHLYDFFDSTIPENLDFSKYRIDGEVITLVFQSGMLAGREFEITQNESKVTGYVHSERRFKLVPQEIDGTTMPNATYKPAIGDKYAIFGIMLPDEYIADDLTKSGSSWDMFREAVKHKYENEDPRFTFTGELDGLWAKRDWENIVGRLIPGGFVLFSDDKFLPDGVPIRIVGIKDYINKPHSPKIDLSNVTTGGGFRSTIERLGQNEVMMDDRHKDSISFTKRRFRDARETMDMLSNSLLNFSEGISPIWAHTMQLLVGDESLQFRFVNNKTNPSAVTHEVKYNATTKQLTAGVGILQHMTLGITNISSSHRASEYRFWNIPAYVSDSLTDPKAYYFYAKVPRVGTIGEFRLESDAIGMHDDPNYYYLLMGFLNSEYDGDRSYVQMYGFTEILPGQIITDIIRSADGKTYFNLAQSEIGGNIKFLATDGSSKNVADVDDEIDEKRRVFVDTPYPPYDIGDLWVNGTDLRRCSVARASGNYAANDWVKATAYDNTVTTINGGVVTSGTVQLAGSEGSILAGITGQGASNDSVRQWAGASFENRTTAPFRVMQDGSFVASKATIEGAINATSGYIGGFDIGANRIGRNTTEAGLIDGMSLNPYWIKFGDTYYGSQVMFGSNTYPPSMGGLMTALRIAINNPNTNDGRDNTGISIDVRGHPEEYASSGHNKALDITSGHFYLGANSRFMGLLKKITVTSSTTSINVGNARNVLLVGTKPSGTVTINAGWTGQEINVLNATTGSGTVSFSVASGTLGIYQGQFISLIFSGDGTTPVNGWFKSHY